MGNLLHPDPQPLGLAPSFGYGDRLGCATPGHAAAAKDSGITGIFAQQSIRELTRTARTAEAVMTAAREGLAASGWSEPWGADADHLKTPADVDRMASAGFRFFTIDPSGDVDPAADTDDEPTLRAKFDAVRDEVPRMLPFIGKSLTLDTGTRIELTEEAVMRAAVKYGRAVNRTVELANYIHGVHEKLGRDYEIELSVDETERPTTLAEHYLVAARCLEQGVKLVSLAPRFIGEMEKGVDYIGDVAAAEASIADHHAIARLLGPYKLSLHSGSDKISLYTPFARATRGLFHVKTAGTSYLEALRVAAQAEPALFRGICAFGREHYDTDKATYHVHATLADTPDPAGLSDRELEQAYLECWEDVPAGLGFTAPGRQILHCTFGSVLTDPTLGPAVHGCLRDHADLYAELLELHFRKHLDALRAGMP